MDAFLEFSVWFDLAKIYTYNFALSCSNLLRIAVAREIFKLFSPFYFLVRNRPAKRGSEDKWWNYRFSQLLRFGIELDRGECSQCLCGVAFSSSRFSLYPFPPGSAAAAPGVGSFGYRDNLCMSVGCEVRDNGCIHSSWQSGREEAHLHHHTHTWEYTFACMGCPSIKRREWEGKSWMNVKCTRMNSGEMWFVTPLRKRNFYWFSVAWNFPHCLRVWAVNHELKGIIKIRAIMVIPEANNFLAKILKIWCL